MKLQTVGVVLLVLGILIIAGFGIYRLMILEDIPLVIRIALSIIGAGALVIILALIRERTIDIKKEKREKEG